jgi:hypothetical protein
MSRFGLNFEVRTRLQDNGGVQLEGSSMAEERVISREFHPSLAGSEEFQVRFNGSAEPNHG